MSRWLRLRSRTFASMRAAALAGLALAFAMRAEAAPKSYDLLLNVAPDRVLKYRLDSQSDGTYQGSTFKNTVMAEVEIQHLTDVKSDNLVFLVHFLQVQAASQQGDHRSPQSLELDGVKTQVEVTTRGRVLKVTPQADVTPMQQRLLENFANAFFLELPDKPVKVGDTWTIELNKTGGGTGTGAFRLDAVDAKSETAQLTGNLHVTSESPALEGKGQVACSVAVQGGYTLSSKGKIDLSGDGPSIVQSYELKLHP